VAIVPTARYTICKEKLVTLGIEPTPQSITAHNITHKTAITTPAPFSLNILICPFAELGGLHVCV